MNRKDKCTLETLSTRKKINDKEINNSLLGFPYLLRNYLVH